MHILCYGTIHDYVVYLCDSVWFCCIVEANLFRLFYCLSVSTAVRSNYQDGEVSDPSNWVSTNTFVPVPTNPQPGLPLAQHILVIFVFINLMWEVVLRFVYIGGTVDSKCVSFLFLFNNWQKGWMWFHNSLVVLTTIASCCLYYPLFFILVMVNSILHNICLISWRIVLALRKGNYPEKTIDQPQVTHKGHRVHLATNSHLQRW